MGLGATATARLELERSAAASVGAAAAADQLLGLSRATHLGSRLQPVGILVLRNLDPASVLGVARRPAT